MEAEPKPPEYLIPEAREALALDPRVGEIEVDLDWRGGVLVVGGSVPNEERRRAVGDVLAERFPDVEVRNEVGVHGPEAPPTEERVG